MAQNIFANSLDVGQKVYDQQQQFRQDFGATQAGKRLAGGDRAGAMQALGASGNVDGVRVLQDDQMKADDRQSDADKEAKAERAKVVLTVAGRLKGVQPGGRKAALQSAYPLFQAAQIDTGIFDGLSEEQLGDQNLDMFSGQVQRELQFFQNDSGIYTGDKATGQVKQVQAFTPKREANWKERTLPDGSTEWFDLNAEAGGQPDPEAPISTAPRQAADPAAVVASLTSMGARVTSGTRTAERNRQIGGVANSRHLTGQAADLVPPAGMTMAQLAAETRARLPGARVINEGDHVHVQWDDRLQGGSGSDTVGPGRSGIRGSAPKPREWVDLPGGGQRNTRTGQTSGIPSAKEKAPTDGDKKNVGFAYRTLRANDRMNALADRGVFKPRTATSQLFENSKSGVVRVVTKTQEDRLFIQAAKEWLAPILRKDTGAAVTDAELATYMDIYIPRYEDGQAEMQQKAEARQDAMVALTREAGSNYGRTHGDRKFSTKYPSAKPRAGAAKPSLDKIFGD